MTPDELDAYVRALVDAAPPLSPAQRDRIASVLRASARLALSGSHPVASARNDAQADTAEARATRRLPGPHGRRQPGRRPLPPSGPSASKGATS